MATYSVGAGPNGVTFKPAAADSAEHDAHHPAQDQAAPAPGTGMLGADSLNGMPGMPGMMGVMTPEMMEIMHGMMAMRGDRARLSGMMMCPMMREMMGMASGAGPRTGEGGMDPRALYGMPAAVQEMTVESVRAWLEQRLAWHGNPRLKIGEIAAAGDATITAEIVTVDGSLVQKLAFNRYPGLVRQLAE